jgi:hypothetical protein
MGMIVAPMRPMASRNIKVVTWIVRLVALAVLIVLFIISIREFYSAPDPSKVLLCFFFFFFQSYCY